MGSILTGVNPVGKNYISHPFGLHKFTTLFNKKGRFKEIPRLMQN
jgi:hypothetical protein